MVVATVLTLLAAALHVLWNLLVRTSEDRLLSAWAQSLVGGMLLAPVAVALTPPSGASLAFLLASCVIHLLYVSALARAYDVGDFSLAYPLARGAGALLAAGAGAVVLADHLTRGAWAGVATVGAGLGLLVGRRPDAHALRLALATGVAIGTYTVLDAAGSRRSSALSYSSTLAVGIGLALTAVLVAQGHAPRMRATLRSGWRRHLVGGIASVAAYAMVLTAARAAPIGYVATLREASIVLGALAGWLLLHERFGRTRATASAVVVAGLTLLVGAQ